MTFGWFVFLCVVCLIAYGIYVLLKKRNEYIDALILETNKKHNTQFSRKDGLGGDWDYIFFDVNNRKLLVNYDGRTSRVEDFSFIKEWQLTWITTSTAHSVSYENVQMVITTNDYQTPLIHLPCSTKAHGDQWSARLSILLT